MDGSDVFEVNVLRRISDVDASEWDACACPEASTGRPNDPFTTHRFLKALEDSGSAAGSAGWIPLHLMARSGGRAVAAMPLYAKTNSAGEFVFDYGWAHAFERAGGRYYPKLQSSVPFTPATGRRFLTVPGMEKTGIEALSKAALEISESNGLSSFHITFCTCDEVRVAERLGFLHRTGEQFHWRNPGYSNFDEYLSGLSSRKRKNIRRERRRASEFGGTIHALTGDRIREEHWDAFWEFYQDTGSRKWGSPYLSRTFFDCIHETMRDDTLLVMCERNGRFIAGALNFIGRDALFGRYWGCIEDHYCLHFEACYYQAIEFAIANGFARVEAGAQGPHKLARGYMPVATHSLHWIKEPSFREAVRNFLDDETAEVQREIDMLSEMGPFKKPENDAP